MKLNDIMRSAQTLGTTRKILRELMREAAPHEPVRLSPAPRPVFGWFQKKTPPFDLKAGEVEVWLDNIHQHHPSFFDDTAKVKPETVKKSNAA